eukprot:PLAT13196.1.p2 GENE.PLAT13196.1~~PLAT13196.1.p2  ORF type:complete len:132 (+),score=18.43 PLAT13196.1:71-466(+)
MPRVSLRCVLLAAVVAAIVCYYAHQQKSEAQIDTSMDAYDVLGVQRDATTKEIKRAFRKLARKYHPSFEPDSLQQYLRIAHCWEAVHNDGIRAAYDAGGWAAVRRYKLLQAIDADKCTPFGCARGHPLSSF